MNAKQQYWYKVRKYQCHWNIFLFTSKENHAYKEDRLKWLSLLDVNYRCQEIISAINGVMPLIKYVLPSELK